MDRARISPLVAAQGAGFAFGMASDEDWDLVQLGLDWECCRRAKHVEESCAGPELLGSPLEVQNGDFHPVLF
ncbi:hypothetical protein L917_17307 [Phytophthora nicotianae]|uniref:Uncharacterized protein n=1 Tax=Phytophthora nicotianae TaxID=4792 RepID=W2KBE1_PHYNI|nr:hypothetical protein L917_17307 [Phytophthora nicotianae]